MRNVALVSLCILFLASCGVAISPINAELQPPSGNQSAAHERLPRRPLAQKNTFSEDVLYNFGSGSTAPKSPSGPLLAGPQGAFYGTTVQGGAHAGGVVYKLTSSGIFEALYAFGSTGSDGYGPVGGVVRDSSGNLFGVTQLGGTYDYGTVFELTPSGSTYSEQILHNFNPNSDGAYPVSSLTMDSSGNLYGVTPYGGPYTCGGVTGPYPCGVVFKLSKSGSSYSFSVIYRFQPTGDGKYPQGGVVVDASGDIFGTASFGGEDCTVLGGCGIAFELLRAGSTYTKSTIYYFKGKANGDGADPNTHLVEDSSGNLYGTTELGGAAGCTNGCGIEFKLVRCTSLCETSYKESWLYDFSSGGSGSDTHAYPMDLVEDSSGDLYGTTADGSGTGTALETSASTGSTTTIYTFPGSSDGENPSGGLVIGSGGNFIGATTGGGAHSEGVIYRLSAGSFPRRRKALTTSRTLAR